MTTTAVPTFTATIYVGLRAGRSGDPRRVTRDAAEAGAICRDYCDRVGLCVSVAPIDFIYTGGGEPGVAVGLINYPRVPSSPEDVRAKALELGELLRVGLGQMKVSVVFPGETVMLGDLP